MAKEMIIIFVYDTQLLTHERDDPASAILYFHPHWVSDQLRTALCGQIMGTFHCLKSIFTTPGIIALQSGKFSIQEYGRYILAVGTDRNIPDWVLQYRAETLSSLIELFHNNLDVMAEIYKNESFPIKLYHMLETYLKILMYSGNIFCNIPALKLPKSASNVYVEAIELLQTCQGINFVLGGAMLYHNKVIATQLSSDLTKSLILTDPYRIKSPADSVEVDYQLPIGVQLLKIYIQEDEFEDLYDDSVVNRNISQYFSNKFIPRKIGLRTATSKDNILSVMKRDQSLIFTTVPEEDCENPVNLENIKIHTKPPNRPKFLNLRNKTTDVKPEEVKTVPSTPFLGQTSVCSTPLTELNKVLHQKVMSICIDPNDDAAKSEIKPVLSAISENSDCLQQKDALFKAAPYVMITKNLLNTRNNCSMINIYEKMNDKSPVKQLKRVKSIGDPTFPLLTSSGMNISKTLYNIYLNKHVNTLHKELTVNHLSETHTEEWKSLEDICSNDSKKEIEEKTITTNMKSNLEHRKSLTLPLKSLSDSEQLFSPAVRSKNYGGVQLTPLMSKLSMLAATEERSSGFCSTTTTPSDYKDFRPSFIKNSKNKGPKHKDVRKKESNILRETVLFVCGQQDMVVVLVIEEQAAKNQDIITSLWENCTEYLGRIEKQLRQCLEMHPGGSQSENGEPYSYLCMDSEWNTVQRGGPWGGMELGSLTHIHRDFCENALTEILLRDDESIIYGYHMGKTEIFYQQSASSAAGLPTPADAMGTVPLKAKRRLERDHALILL